MGLIVRLYDIVSPNDFQLSIGTSPYGYFQVIPKPDGGLLWPSSNVRDYRVDPIYIGNNQPRVTDGTPQPSDISECDIKFDTEYWFKIEDSVLEIHGCDPINKDKRYIIENIYIHDSKAFQCYDKIAFRVEIEDCPPQEIHP